MVIHIGELMMSFSKVWVEVESVSIIGNGPLVGPTVCPSPQQVSARYVSFREIGIQSEGLSHRRVRLLNPLRLIYLYTDRPSSKGRRQRSVSPCELRINFHGFFKKPDGLIGSVPSLKTVIRLRS